jgi:hypothetical protein
MGTGANWYLEGQGEQGRQGEQEKIKFIIPSAQIKSQSSHLFIFLSFYLFIFSQPLGVIQKPPTANQLIGNRSPTTNYRVP